MSNKLLLKRLQEKRHQQLCNAYIDKVHDECSMKAKFGCNPSVLDPIKDLDGVFEDVYTPFFNLHNPLLAHAPMESNDGMSVEKYLDQNPPKFDMIDPLDPNDSKIEAIFDAIENLTIEYAPFSKVPPRFWDQLDALNTYFQLAEMSKTPTKK